MNLICKACQKPFSPKDKNLFCSRACYRDYYGKIKVQCQYCELDFLKYKSQIKKTKKNFCSQTCFGKFICENRKNGVKRSKLEIYIEKELKSKFPSLNFLFNNREIIESELDIYIPSLRLAFELNGVFHYEPLFGTDKLNKIKIRDQQKFKKCIENNVELCIIDSSALKYFKEDNAKKYLEIIINIIQNRLA